MTARQDDQRWVERQRFEYGLAARTVAPEDMIPGKLYFHGIELVFDEDMSGDERRVVQYAYRKK